MGGSCSRDDLIIKMQMRETRAFPGHDESIVIELGILG
jgi:hypothetical protein